MEQSTQTQLLSYQPSGFQRHESSLERYHRADHYQFNPVKTVEANVVGTLNALRLAHQIRARILQASTSEVYGDPTVHPQVETYRATSTLSAHAPATTKANVSLKR